MVDISVVIPCYNNAPHVRLAVESALSQQPKPRQVIVIDDGSTDGSAEILKELSETRPEVEAVFQQNAGGSKARNAGLQRVTGNYIAFLDADDLWLPGKLKRQIELLESDTQAISTHTRVFNFQDDINDLNREETERTLDRPSLKQLVEYHYVGPSAMVFRAEPCTKHGLRFRDEYRNHAEDLLFCADLLEWGQHRLVDEPLTAKRIHQNQISSKPWHRIWSAENRISWLREHEDQIGSETTEEMTTMLGQSTMTFLENRYWRRNVTDLSKMIAYVNRFAPKAVAASELAGRRIYPRWVYKLKDTFVRRQ